MTNTTDFADVLALSNGASFVRGDLHIHSVVGSHDVTDPQATPENIVQTAIDSGLSVIAIADHNEITAVAGALAAAVGKPLLVVPAVELSTMQGHLLCYLPDLRSLQQFHAQLTVRDSGNATSRVENSMIDCLNKLQATVASLSSLMSTGRKALSAKWLERARTSSTSSAIPHFSL